MKNDFRDNFADQLDYLIGFMPGYDLKLTGEEAYKAFGAYPPLQIGGGTHHLQLVASHASLSQLALRIFTCVLEMVQARHLDLVHGRYSSSGGSRRLKPSKGRG